MAINKESIYGTDASPFFKLPWGRCTQKETKKGTTLYLHVFDWPKDQVLRVPGLQASIRKAYLLADKQQKLSYKFVYCKDTIEIQKDVIKEGQRIIICDDLLATGGTAKASAKLIEKVGGKIMGFAFVIELTESEGIKGINKYNCKSLVKY